MQLGVEITNGDFFFTGTAKKQNPGGEYEETGCGDEEDGLSALPDDSKARSGSAEEGRTRYIYMSGLFILSLQL